MVISVNKSGCYSITNTINDNCYISSSIHIDIRFRQHINALKNQNHHSSHLQNAWNKYGEEKFNFKIILLCADTDRISEEQSLLDTLNPAYNISKYAHTPMLGRLHTAESREKLSISHKGLPSPNKGKVMSEEQKKKISQSRMGKCSGKHHKRSRSLINTATGEIYYSIAEASRKLNIKSPQLLSAMLTGQLSNTSGITYL